MLNFFHFYLKCVISTPLVVLFTMINSMKLNPRDHQALESDLITLHMTRLDPKNVHKGGQIEGLKDMNRAGPKL